MSQQTEAETKVYGNSAPSTGADAGTAAPRRWWVLALVLIATAALLASGIRSRLRADKTLSIETSQVAVTPVSVVSPKQTAAAQEIILPGNVEPFINSPIYSRTNGYLKQWFADIGAHVKQGQLLAVHMRSRSRSRSFARSASSRGNVSPSGPELLAMVWPR